MDELSKLQDELKQTILAFEEKATGNKIDNKHLIKQFTALVKNENINEELINFIIDSTDEINTRHFQFVEHTTKTIKDISEIAHKDIEKLKKILETTKVNCNVISMNTKVTPWYDIRAWSLTEFKSIFTLVLIFMVLVGLIVNAGDKEFYKTIQTVVTPNVVKEKKE